MTDKIFPTSTWPTRLVAEVGDIEIGQAIQRRSNEPQKPYLRVANVMDGFLDVSDVATMPVSVKNTDRLRLKNGDILLCEGQSRELVGRAAMFRDELEEVYFQNHLIRFRAGPDVLPEYALLVFRSYQYSGIFSEISRSTTNIAHMSKSRFSKLTFPVPELAVQEKIVGAARIVSSQLDDAHRRIVEVTNLLRKLLPLAREVVIFGESLVTSSIFEASASAEDWILLRDCVDPQSPITYGVLQPGDDATDSDAVPYVRGVDLKDGYIATSQVRYMQKSVASRYPRSELRTGDVLVGLIRNTRVAVVPPELNGGQITQGAALVRPGPDVSSAFLFSWLSSSAAQGWLTSRLGGLDMPRVNLRDLRELPVPRLSQAAQRRATRALEKIDDYGRFAVDGVAFSTDRVDYLRKVILPSLAYGSMGKAIAERTSETAESLISMIESSIANSTGEAHIRPDAPTPREREPDAVLTISELDSAIRVADGPITPERLFQGLGLQSEHIDEFYQCLRELARRQAITVSQVGDFSVEIAAIG